MRETGRRLGREGNPCPEVEIDLELEGIETRRTVKFFVRSDARARVGCPTNCSLTSHSFSLTIEG